MQYRKIAGGLLLGFFMSISCPNLLWAEGPGGEAQTESQENAVGPGAFLDQGTLENTGDNTGGAETGSYVVDTGFAALEVASPVVQIAEKYSYEQMVQDIQTLQSKYGSHMQVQSYGTSLDGRALYDIIVGNPNAGKSVMIQGGIHGREYMTPLLVMKQAEAALEFYDTASYQGQSLASMFDQVQIHFLPMVNPDGVSISQFGLSSVRPTELQQVIQAGHEKDMEENRTATPFDLYLPYWKSNARGVDLNRNFDAYWDQVVNSPGHASYTGYKGTNPGSEPESAALIQLADSRNWSAVINFHSMGEVIYWDINGNKVEAQSKELAQAASAITGYQILNSDGTGGFKDWLQIKNNPVPSITLEVGNVSCPLPVSQWPGVWSQNKSIWAAVLKYAWEH